MDHKEFENLVMKAIDELPQGFKDSTASVILQVGDKSGREIHHTFTIRVK